MLLRANNLGAHQRITFMFELPSTGYVLPSFDVIPRLAETAKLHNAEMLLYCSLVFTCLFVVLELFELSGLQDGQLELSDLTTYFTNLWNLMDWANYIIFFIAFVDFYKYFALVRAAETTCVGLCATVGYKDDWELHTTLRMAKQNLAMCVCIQLLKIVKFSSVLVPKMGLAPLVMKKALPDLVFHSSVFVISMIAFSTCFFIQLGPVMQEFYEPSTAFLSLGRALFGDFDILEILENSRGYFNAILFLTYLFVAIFILLSMFFAILGEAQANLRDDQLSKRKQDEADFKEPDREYGVISLAYDKALRLLADAPVIGPHIKKSRLQGEVQAIDGAVQEGASAVDRIESRQLELDEKIDLLLKASDLRTQKDIDKEMRKRPQSKWAALRNANKLTSLAKSFSNCQRDGSPGAGATPSSSTEGKAGTSVSSAASMAAAKAAKRQGNLEATLSQVLTSIQAMQQQLDELSWMRPRQKARPQRARPSPTPPANGTSTNACLGSSPSPNNGCPMTTLSTSPASASQAQSQHEERAEWLDAMVA